MICRICSCRSCRWFPLIRCGAHSRASCKAAAWLDFLVAQNTSVGLPLEWARIRLGIWWFRPLSKTNSLTNLPPLTTWIESGTGRKSWPKRQMFSGGAPSHVPTSRRLGTVALTAMIRSGCASLLFACRCFHAEMYFIRQTVASRVAPRSSSAMKCTSSTMSSLMAPTKASISFHLRDTLSHFSGVERMMSAPDISLFVMKVSPVTSARRSPRVGPNLSCHSKNCMRQARISSDPPRGKQ